jgi:CxxC motif-containing protein (DUF1111 family)
MTLAVSETREDIRQAFEVDLDPLEPEFRRAGPAERMALCKRRIRMSSLRQKLSRGGVLASVFFGLLLAVPLVYAAVDAPTGFDNLTNGRTAQTFFDTNRDLFEDRETLPKLGPVYNAQSCAECHQNPVSGSASQIAELRAGQTVSGIFTDHSGGSLINDRAIDPSIQEHVADTDNTRALRISLSVLGAGFVEAIPDSEFTRIQNEQIAAGLTPGKTILVPILEAPLNSDGTQPTRIGRFGWKDQHASLVSFAADAYLNEMGITNPLFPNENTSDGNSVASFDQFPEASLGLEDPATTNHPFGKDVEAFASFMRSTKAPSRGPITADVTAGEEIFHTIGCEDCHTDSITTASSSTVFNVNDLGASDDSKFSVGVALGDKTIHPYGDYMLHNVGTGDGIVQNGGAATRNMVRTAPLWGLRTRTRLMHDGLSLTITDAILAHGGQAAASVTSFNGLTPTQKAKLLAFLKSL